MRVVHIEWVDSETEVGWEALEALSGELDLCHTVGFLIAETEHFAVIANSYDPANEESNGRISIPLCSIKEMRTLCHLKMR